MIRLECFLKKQRRMKLPSSVRYDNCEFLNTIHQAEPDEREENKNWARNMGWNGRMHKVENIL